MTHKSFVHFNLGVCVICIHVLVDIYFRESQKIVKVKTVSLESLIVSVVFCVFVAVVFWGGCLLFYFFCFVLFQLELACFRLWFCPK